MPDLTETPLVRPVEFDAESDTYRTRYDWSSPVSLTTAVVELVAEIADTDPRHVDRLVTGVDPEALDAVFAPLPSAESRQEGSISFVLGDYRVTVRGTGDIEVTARARAD